MDTSSYNKYKNTRTYLPYYYLLLYLSAVYLFYPTYPILLVWSRSTF